MYRKVQAFSIPSKVSIGQDRNKKDPHRGRKQSDSVFIHSVDNFIEIKKIPIGDGNNKRKAETTQPSLIEIKKIPIGDGNPFAKNTNGVSSL